MSSYWRPRDATKRGWFHPPREGTSHYGQAASSAMRRHEGAVWDRLRTRDYVQLAPGVLVVWNHQPWRIVETRERPQDRWGQEYEQRFTADLEAWERWGRGKKPQRATWRHSPVVVVLVPAGDPAAEPVHLVGPASHCWTVLPEHYAVCVACGELPPCRHEVAEAEAERISARADVLMDIPPGHCLGCGEVITSRQKTTRFPGPNLWRPDLGDNSAVFHAREDCSSAVFRYREQWATKGNEEPQAVLPFDEQSGGTA